MARFDPQPRWTRDHERFVEAWAALDSARARRGEGSMGMSRWIERRFGVGRVIDLTASQARQGRRSLNAWRAGIEGRAAHNTATTIRTTRKKPSPHKASSMSRDVLQQECAR